MSGNWDETASEFDEMDIVTDDRGVVNGGDYGTFTAFTAENRDHQLNFVHVGRTLDYNLWDDCVFSLDYSRR